MSDVEEVVEVQEETVNKNFMKCVSYKLYYVKWMVNWWKILVFKIANKRLYVKC